MARPGAFGADIGTGSYHNSGPMKVTGLRYQFKQPPGTQKKMTNSRYYQVPGRRHLSSHLSIPHFSTSLISLYLILGADTQRPLQRRRRRRGRRRGGSAWEAAVPWETVAIQQRQAATGCQAWGRTKQSQGEEREHEPGEVSM